MVQSWESLPRVTSVDQLEDFGVPDPVARDKVEARLQPVHREWIDACSLLFVATASAEGQCDVSPKGDPPGFIHVLDDTTVVVPERAGNKRMDGFHNLLSNPKVGMLLVIPGRADTLRINGSARLVTDGPFFDRMVVRGHRPRLALLVSVEEVFFHCPKSFVRAHAWDSDSWAPEAARSYPEIAQALWRRDEELVVIEARLTPAVIESQLYPREE